MIQFLEEAEKLIKINSVSSSGSEEVSLYVQNLLNAMGFKTILQEITHSVEGVSKRQFNIIGILGDPLVDTKTRKGFLLSSHIDTTSPGLKTHWTETGGDPFRATIKEDRIYGLGSADLKLNLLCKLKAAEKYTQRKLRSPLYIAGTSCSEFGLVGAKFMIKSKVLNPQNIIVGEPSNLAVICQSKSQALYWVSIGYPQKQRDAKGFNTKITLSCTGKAAHGCHPGLGENAIEALLTIIQKIKAANFQIRFTSIEGGEYSNKVPDKARMEFYISSSSFDDFKRFYRENLNQKNIQVEFGGLGETGVNFLPDNMLDAIENIRKTLIEMRADILSPESSEFNPSSSTVNFSKINYKLGLLELFFDVRLLPTVNGDEFYSNLKSRIQKINFGYPEFIFKVLRQRMNSALNIDPNHELVKSAHEAQKLVGISAGIEKSSTTTECSEYQAAGFDSISFGPGIAVGNSHSPNEYITVDQLDKAVHFYDRMIERYCL